MRILRSIWTYLKDWRNWVAHSIIGIAILVAAIYLPVKPIYRIIILLLVVTFNIVRMQLAKKKKSKT